MSLCRQAKQGQPNPVKTSDAIGEDDDVHAFRKNRRLSAESAPSLPYCVKIDNEQPRVAFMQIVDIVWLPHIVDKLAWKHQVVPQEVDEVFFSGAHYRKVQKGHISGEDVYAAMGRTEAGRYLIIFFVYKKTREALILSARDMDRKERRLYERR